MNEYLMSHAQREQTTMLRKMLTSVLVLALSASVADAAEIYVKMIKSGTGKKSTTMPVVYVQGDIEVGDNKKFYDVAKKLSAGRVLVFLSSDGGNLSAGLNIGEMIRVAKWSTVASGTCASVCGLMWLAGVPRYVFTDSSVGFHAAYRLEKGEDGKNYWYEAGQGNAIVGAYLTRLGFGYNTIAFLTGATPDSMEWLDDAKSKKYGINIIVHKGG
jgi:hypothetical protein